MNKIMKVNNWYVVQCLLNGIYWVTSIGRAILPVVIPAPSRGSQRYHVDSRPETLDMISWSREPTHSRFFWTPNYRYFVLPPTDIQQCDVVVELPK